MRHAAFIVTVAATAFAMHATPAAAQANRTFVSGTADINNVTCSRTSPCRSFATAIGLTNAGGEIVALDSAGYGPFTIDKAISVSAQGVEAAITTTSGDGITINANPGDVVNLRSLTLTGGGGNNGITFNTGGTLNIQNCVVRGFSQNGLNLVPNTQSNINVSETIVSNNGATGVYFGPSASGAALFERVRSIGNSQGSGFLVDDSHASAGTTIKALAANSVATEDGFGFRLSSGSASATLMIVNSEVYLNNSGVASNGGSATLIIGNSKIYRHPFFGFERTNLGTLKTFGNNYFANNGGNLGSLTPIGQQ